MPPSTAIASTPAVKSLPVSTPSPAITQVVSAAKARTLNIAFRDAPIAEIMEMLSREERVNIVLGPGVTGSVSVNLYGVSLEQAIRTIAAAAGYVVEERSGEFYVIDKKDAGRESAQGLTQIRSFKVQYSDPKVVSEVLSKHLSRYGKITPLPERKIILVEDTPEFITRIEGLLREVDAAPKQVLIEAKILEITLNDTESFGIDWSRVMSSDGTERFGTVGLAERPATTGFFFQGVSRNIELFLSALSSKGRVRTLSAPKLLALENQEATVKIGDNIGYKLTTTINQVTSESVQFLETGIILRVTPAVNEQGQVLLKIHPEVSTGTLLAGIPSKRTTEVTSELIANDGQAVFVGGLIKRSLGSNRDGVPILGDLPGIGLLFSRVGESVTMTETIVLITPHVIKNLSDPMFSPDRDKVKEIEEFSGKADKALQQRLERGPQMPKYPVGPAAGEFNGP